MGCIYVVTNKINNKMYVGQTKHEDTSKRIKGHIYCSTSLLGRAIRKNSRSNFIIKEYKDIRMDWLDWFEIEMIKHYDCISPNGYNIMLGGQSYRLVNDITSEKIGLGNKGKMAWNKGIPCPEEQKIRTSEKLKGNTPWNKGKTAKDFPSLISKKKGIPCSIEARKKMHDSHIGVPLSEEHRKNIGKANIGKKMPNGFGETVRKRTLGVPKSPETKAKISGTLMGNIPWNKGKKMSKEFIEKDRKSHLGLKDSDETRKNKSIAQIERQKRNKEGR
jgi:hypothetical protein